MDANEKHTQEIHELPAFDAKAHGLQGAHGLTASAAFDPAIWESAKEFVTPMVWAWYDAHKDQKVAKIGGFYQVTVSSFGIAEMVLKAIFGPRTV